MINILSNTFGYFVNRRNRKFDDKGPLYKAPVPVISIGNLSAGGSGKTPFAIMLSRELFNMSLKAAVIGGGYKRKSKGAAIAGNIGKTSGDVGDELQSLYDILNVRNSFGFPALTHDRKYLAAKTATEKFDIDCIVLDDGFQHRQLHRDLDIVLIDDRTMEEPYLLPKGRLRETFAALKRADIICLTGDFDFNDIIEEHGLQDKLIIRTEVINETPYNLMNSNDLVDHKKEKFKDGVIAMSGLARPGKFEKSLANFGVEVKYHFAFDDHHEYKISDLKESKKKCVYYKTGCIATTEKDAVKLRKFGSFFDNNNIECRVFPIEMRISEGNDSFMKMLEEILK